jgi:hypothetical protein
LILSRCKAGDWDHDDGVLGGGADADGSRLVCLSRELTCIAACLGFAVACLAKTCFGQPSYLVVPLGMVWRRPRADFARTCLEMCGMTCCGSFEMNVGETEMKFGRGLVFVEVYAKGFKGKVRR